MGAFNRFCYITCLTALIATIILVLLTTWGEFPGNVMRKYLVTAITFCIASAIALWLNGYATAGLQKRRKQQQNNCDTEQPH